MAKIKLGARPKNFKHTITVPLHEGSSGTIVVSYRYRTRTEFGAFVDELFAAAQVTPKSASAEDVQFSLRESLQRQRDQNVEYIMRVLDGWDLDEEFSRDAVQQLCDELPGAAFAIMDQYRNAIQEGRLGN